MSVFLHTRGILRDRIRSRQLQKLVSLNDTTTHPHSSESANDDDNTSQTVLPMIDLTNDMHPPEKLPRVQGICGHGPRVQVAPPFVSVEQFKSVAEMAQRIADNPENALLDVADCKCPDCPYSRVVDLQL
jgi:hypothetical protein